MRTLMARRVREKTGRLYALYSAGCATALAEEGGL